MSKHTTLCPDSLRITAISSAPIHLKKPAICLSIYLLSHSALIFKSANEFGVRRNGTMITYKYSEKGVLTEESKFDARDVLIERKIYRYNSLGERTEEITTDKDDRILKRAEFSYNEKGLKTEKRAYDAVNKLVSVKRYSYSY